MTTGDDKTEKFVGFADDCDGCHKLRELLRECLTAGASFDMEGWMRRVRDEVEPL